jgi:hypothetical protein
MNPEHVIIGAVIVVGLLGFAEAVEQAGGSILDRGPEPRPATPTPRRRRRTPRIKFTDATKPIRKRRRGEKQGDPKQEG